MYKYDEYDQEMVDTRVAEFRDQVERRLSGKLSEEQFRPLRLMNGLYLQLHALHNSVSCSSLAHKNPHVHASPADGCYFFLVW